MNYFGSHALKINKSPDFTYPKCLLHLSIKCYHTNEYEEATDRIESRQLQHKRCSKIVWIYKSYNSNHTHESLKLLKLHNWRNQNKVISNNSKSNKNNFTLDTNNVDSAANDRYFHDLQNKEEWISFTSNLCHVRKEDRKFMTTIYENKAD